MVKLLNWTCEIFQDSKKPGFWRRKIFWKCLLADLGRVSVALVRRCLWRRISTLHKQTLYFLHMNVFRSYPNIRLTFWINVLRFWWCATTMQIPHVLTADLRWVGKRPIKQTSVLKQYHASSHSQKLPTPDCMQLVFHETRIERYLHFANISFQTKIQADSPNPPTGRDADLKRISWLDFYTT